MTTVPEKTDKRNYVNKGGRNPIAPEKKKRMIAITITTELIGWAKEWAAKRDRSLSWAMNYFAQQYRNNYLAEKHLGKKFVRTGNPHQ